MDTVTDVVPYTLPRAELKDKLPEKTRSPTEVMALDAFQTDLQEGIERFNQSFSILQRNSQVFVMHEGTDINGENFIAYLTVHDFHTLTAHERVWHPEMEKYIPISAVWLSWSGRNVYNGLHFRPVRYNEDRIINERFYNLWHGFKYKPNADAGKFDILLDHIQTNICDGNEDHYKWVMAWLADIFQNPADKPGTALVLRGQMGIGKGAFASHIGKLLGKHYCTILNSSQIIGKFNGHLADKILMFVDESFWNGEKNGAGILRGLITESHIACEAKGKDLIMVDSFMRLIVAANDDWAVPVGMNDERRMNVLDVNPRCQRNYAYFTEMVDQLNKGGYEAFMAYLMAYEYEPTLPRTILKTSALLDQKLHSMPHDMKWWHECLTFGRIMQGDDYWPEKIKCDDMYLSYHNWCEENKVRTPLARNSLPKYMKKYNNMIRRRTKPDGWHYFIPSLDDSRIQFDHKVGGCIDWGNDSEQ